MSRPFTSLYVYTFFSGFMPIYALFTLFVLDCGMSASQLSVLLAAWSITGFALEVPSGALADRTSRKRILAVSQALNGLAFALWAILPTFYGVLIGFILWGAKSALVSGTYEAYVYDELKSLSREAEYTAIYGRLQTCRAIAALLAAISAAPLSAAGYRTVIWCSVGASMLSVLAAHRMPEAPRIKRIGEGAYFGIVRDSIGTLLRDRAIFVTAFALASVSTLASMTGDLGPIIGRISGLPQYAIGLFVAAGYAMIALAGMTASRVALLFGPRFDRLFPIAAIVFTVAAVLLNMSALVLVCFWIYALSVLIQLHNNELQRRSSSDIRATVSSLIGLAGTALQVSLTLAVGAVANVWSYQAACIGLGVTAFALGLIPLLLRKNIRP